MCVGDPAGFSPSCVVAHMYLLVLPMLQLQSAQSAAGEELIMLRSSLAVAQQESAGARAHVQELTRQLQVRE